MDLLAKGIFYGHPFVWAAMSAVRSEKSKKSQTIRYFQNNQFLF
jgi:hypothetical protein